MKNEKQEILEIIDGFKNLTYKIKKIMMTLNNVLKAKMR